MTDQWAFMGRHGRIVVDVLGAGPDDRLPCAVSAELDGHGRFTGVSTVAFTTAELARFEGELGAMLDGAGTRATLGRLGDEVGLTLETVDGHASLSGFVGAGSVNAVSFNDLEIERLSLLRAHRALSAILGSARVPRTQPDRF